MRFFKKKEWKDYLLDQFKDVVCGGYAVIDAGDGPELLYFSKHLYEGNPWLLESPTGYRKIEILCKEYERDYEALGYILRGPYGYEVDCPQVPPFLPDEVDILAVLGEDEEKALDYLLAQK